VSYDFTIQPIGEVWQGSYFVITLPDDVGVYSERDIERKCDYNVVGFATNSEKINCKVNGNRITVSNGFRFKDSTAMTDDDDFIPPTFKFTLPQFRNPRTVGYSGVFEIAIYDSKDDLLYSWDSTNTTYALTVNGGASYKIAAGPVI
jgi:hypothetical protein